LLSRGQLSFKQQRNGHVLAVNGDHACVGGDAATCLCAFLEGEHAGRQALTGGVALRSRRAGQDIQHETAGIFVVLAIK